MRCGTNGSWWVAALLLLAPGLGQGAGFRVAEHGAAATGMVGAFVAKADDASTLYFNPAGLAKLRGLQVYVGTTLIVGGPHAMLTNPDGSTLRVGGDVVFVPIPSLYVSYGLPCNLAFGVGAFADYGLRVGWPTGWPGRLLVTEAALSTVTINPSMAWAPVPWIAIGGGADITPASLEVGRGLAFGDAIGEARFRANTVGISGNVGLLISVPRLGPMVPFNIGASYRSRYDLDFDAGVLELRVPLELSSTLRDRRARIELPVPDAVTVGVGVQVTERLFLQGQFDWIRWSRFKQLSLEVPSDTALNVELRQQWHDGYTLRAGAELNLERVRLRAGGGYDWTPIPRSTLSPILPDADRILMSIGVGFPLPHHFVADFSVMGVIFRKRQSALEEFPARYTNYAVLFGLAVSYRAPACAGCPAKATLPPPLAELSRATPR